MSQYFEIHPTHPQRRLIQRAADMITDGAVIVYPTDSCYALGCAIGDKSAVERIRRIRGVHGGHYFSLVCRDLSEIATYARVDNTVYRLLKNLTPGPFPFVLAATRDVPRRLQNPKRKTIGIRVPDNAIAVALLDTLNQPLISSTLILPGSNMPMTDPREMRRVLEHRVELVIDGGHCGYEPTTVIDLSYGVPEVVRRGKGDTSWLEP